MKRISKENQVYILNIREVTYVTVIFQSRLNEKTIIALHSHDIGFSVRLSLSYTYSKVTGDWSVSGKTHRNKIEINLTSLM